jgi:methylated-DNA-[protein]-cysteine S-methyltransferase
MDEQQKFMQKTIWVGMEENTPLGNLWVGISEDGLVAVDIQTGYDAFVKRLSRLGFRKIDISQEKAQPYLDQISAYLQGQRRAFDFPIDWSIMVGFKEQALRATVGIPYGETRTYAGLAAQIGRPRAARAVGRAEATNPMPLVIPCHRLIGSDGRLHGYGAGEGLATKSWLLQLEREN